MFLVILQRHLSAQVREFRRKWSDARHTYINRFRDCNKVHFVWATGPRIEKQAIYRNQWRCQIRNRFGMKSDRWNTRIISVSCLRATAVQFSSLIGEMSPIGRYVWLNSVLSNLIRSNKNRGYGAQVSLEFDMVATLHRMSEWALNMAFTLIKPGIKQTNREVVFSSYLSDSEGSFGRLIRRNETPLWGVCIVFDSIDFKQRSLDIVVPPVHFALLTNLFCLKCYSVVRYFDRGTCMVVDVWCHRSETDDERWVVWWRKRKVPKRQSRSDEHAHSLSFVDQRSCVGSNNRI